MFSLLRRLRARIKYRHFHRDLAREIETHHAMAQEAFEREGVTPSEASARSSRVLGNVTYMREEARAVWIARWIEHTWQDVRYSLRSLRRQKGFAVGSVLTLGAALGLLTSVFTLYSSIWLRPWEVPSPDDLFIVTAVNKENGRPIWGYDLEAANEFQRRMTTASITTKRDAPFTDDETGRPLDGGEFVGDNFLDVVGLRLQLGHGFTPGSDDPTVVISDRLWKSRFGGRGDVVGQQFRLNKVSTTIVGVLTPEFRGFTPRWVDVLVNASARRRWHTDWGTPQNRCCIEVLGRIRGDHTLDEVAAEASLLGVAILTTEQGSVGDLALIGTAMGAQRRGGPRRELPTVFALVFAASTLVLVLAAANVGNLHLARGLRRQRELVVRMSIGASRSRVLRQLLTESFGLSLIASAVGLGVAQVLPALFVDLNGNDSMFALTPDHRTFVFVAASAVVTCALFGLAPALRVTRHDARGTLVAVVKGAGRIRSVVLGVQVAVCTALVVAATLLVRGIVVTANSDGGFALRELQVASIQKPAGAYDKARNLALNAHLVQQLTGGTEPAFGVTQSPPHHPRSFRRDFGELRHIRVFPMTSSSFGVIGVPVLQGRVHADPVGGREVVVNETFANLMWPGQTALGQSLEGKTVVGVAADARLADITVDEPFLFEPIDPAGLLYVTFRTGASAETRLAQVLKDFDPRLTYSVQPANARVMDQLENSIIGASVAGGIGVLTLLLAMFGIFGVCAFLVEERRRELGIRLALGARRSDVRSAIARVARWPIAGGLIVGLGLAVLAGFLLRSFLLGVSPVDPVTYLLVGALLSMSAAVATWVPMRRAVAVDPAVTLRHD